MESVFVPESCTQPTISLDSAASKADRIAFQQCDVFEKKGSSYRVCCKICGFKVTTSAHKMLSGHYLRAPTIQIHHCISREKLQEDMPEFLQALQDRQTSLHTKRK